MTILLLKHNRGENEFKATIFSLQSKYLQILLAMIKCNVFYVKDIKINLKNTVKCVKYLTSKDDSNWTGYLNHQWTLQPPHTFINHKICDLAVPSMVYFAVLHLPPFMLNRLFNKSISLIEIKD